MGRKPRIATIGNAVIGNSVVSGPIVGENGIAGPDAVVVSVDGSGGDDGRIVNPATVDGSGTGSGGNAETGKKPRKQREKKSESIPLDVNMVEEILFSLHMTAANYIAPEMALDHDESLRLAQATKRLTDHYGDGEISPWTGFAIVAAQIYGPRIYAAGVRRSEEKRAAKAAAKESSITAQVGFKPRPV